MKRFLPVAVVVAIFLLVAPITFMSPKSQVAAAPLGTGSVVLVARDLVDLKWEPATYPNPTGETFRRWEIWRGTIENNYTERVRVGYDKAIDFYRDKNLAVDTTYYYKLDTIFYDPIKDEEKFYTLFRAETTTGVFHGVLYVDLDLSGGTYKLGSSLSYPYPSDTAVVVNKDVTLSMGTGVTITRPSGSAYRIMANGGNLHVDGAIFTGVILYFGNPLDEKSYGYGYVRNATGAGIYLLGESENVEVKKNQDISVSLAGNSSASILENPSIGSIMLNDQAHALIGTNVISYSVSIYDQASADIVNKNTILGEVDINQAGSANIFNGNTIRSGVTVSGYGTTLEKKASANISGNTISSEYQHNGVDVYDGASVILIDNTLEWTGYHGTDSSVLLHVSDEESSVTALRNKFIHGKIGIFWGAAVTVTENVLTGEGSAITIGCVLCGTDVQARGKIEKNTVQNGWGFELWGGSEKEVDGKQAVSILHNCIRNNNPGMTTDDYLITKPVVVKYNWWGHDSGPYHPTLNPTGLGDKIDGNMVDFKPVDEDDQYCLDEPPAPPSPAPASLAVSANPSEVAPNGTATSQVSVEIYDYEGKPVYGEEVSFSLSPALGEFKTNTCISGVDGKCSVYYQAPKPDSMNGELYVTVEARVGNIMDTTEIDFAYLKIQSNLPENGSRNVDWINVGANVQFDREIDLSSVTADTFKLSSSIYYTDGFTCQFETSNNPIIRCNVDLNNPVEHPNADKGLMVTVRLKGGANGIKGKDGTFLRSDYNWKYYTTPFLSPKIIPVQISEGTDLVAGRPAVIRVHAGLSDDSELDWVEASVALDYEDSSSYQRERYRFYPGEYGLGQAIYTGNSANFYSRNGEVPIINSGGNSFKLSATVQPLDQNWYLEPRTYKTESQVYVRLIKNAYAGYKVVAYPVVSSSIFADGKYPWKAGDLIDGFFKKEIIQYGPYGMKYWLPFTHGPIFWPGDRVTEVYNPYGEISYTFLSDMIRINGYRIALFVDVVVMLVPQEVLLSYDLYHQPDYHVCVISIDAKPAAMAHCIGHLLGLVDKEKYWDKWTLRGYDVVADKYVDSELPSLGFTKPLMFRNGGDLTDTWIDQQNYINVFSEFTTSPGLVIQELTNSSMLAVGGKIVQEDGKPEMGLIDVAEKPARNSLFPLPEDIGDYSIELADSQGTTLAVHKFSPAFSTIAEGVDYASFLFTFPAPEETQQIKLWHDTKNLFIMTASNNLPQVKVTNPKAGSYSGEITVSWSGSDPDPDTELHYSLMYSQDGGEHWDALVLDTTRDSFVLDSTSYASCQNCLIKVIAQDGFHSAEAISTSFSVKNPPAVTWVWPADEYQEAGRLTEVVAVFRDPMNASAIGTTTFTLRDQWGNNIAGTVTYNETVNEAVFTPAEALFYGRSYTASLASSIKDTLGQSLGKDIHWTFQVELGPFPVYLPLVSGG